MGSSDIEKLRLVADVGFFVLTRPGGPVRGGEHERGTERAGCRPVPAYGRGEAAGLRGPLGMTGLSYTMEKE